MTKLLKDLGATGNNPGTLSASRVTMYVAVFFYMLAALYVLIVGVAIGAPPAIPDELLKAAVESDPDLLTRIGDVALRTVRSYENAEGAAQLVFEKMWILLAPYFGSLIRDGAVRVAEKRNNGGE